MTAEFITTVIPIEAIPNQSFTITLDGHFYNITIKESAGVMSCSIIRDNIAIQDNARISAGYLLIPYKYQENGNFFILTENDDYPYYDQFGITQYLIYITQAELDVLQSADLNIPDPSDDEL